MIVDASASTRRHGALSKAKGLLSEVFEQARRQRARLALLHATGRHAQWLWQGQKASQALQQWLAELCAGGGTPLFDALQQAADWQALATLPSEVFWRLCQGRMGDTQAVGQAAAKSQAAFADGLRQSLSAWQASVSEAFGASGDTASFAQLCQQWAQPWTAPSTAPQGKAKK